MDMFGDLAAWVGHWIAAGVNAVTGWLPDEAWQKKLGVWGSIGSIIGIPLAFYLAHRSPAQTKLD